MKSKERAGRRQNAIVDDSTEKGRREGDLGGSMVGGSGRTKEAEGTDGGSEGPMNRGSVHGMEKWRKKVSGGRERPSE